MFSVCHSKASTCRIIPERSFDQIPFLVHFTAGIDLSLQTEESIQEIASLKANIEDALLNENRSALEAKALLKTAESLLEKENISISDALEAAENEITAESAEKNHSGCKRGNCTGSPADICNRISGNKSRCKNKNGKESSEKVSAQGVKTGLGDGSSLISAGAAALGALLLKKRNRKNG